MTREQLTEEYEAWLDANPNVPRISADEAVWELCADEPKVRTLKTAVQINWLLDFCDRWEKAS